MVDPSSVETWARAERDVVAADLDLDLVAALVAAREAVDDDDRWRILLSEDVGTAVSDDVVLAAAVEQLRSDGDLAVRATERPSATLLSGRESALAVAGSRAARTTVRETAPATVERVRSAVLAQFERAAPAAVDVPARSALFETARSVLSDPFADDLATVFAGVERLPGSAAVDARTVLLTLAARQGHLFQDVRAFAETVGVASRSAFADERRALVDRGLLRTIELPLGEGHPSTRLQLADDALASCPAGELLDELEDRYAAAGRARRDGSGKETRSPVWKR